jgi:hypothetical protein
MSRDSRIRQTEIPLTSCYRDFIAPINYSDAFVATEIDPDITIQEAYIKIFSDMPTWIKILMKIRNRIVSIFGINTDIEGYDMSKATFATGSTVGMFKIFYIDEREIIAGEDDKHLDFRVSVLKHQDTVTVSTFVAYNHAFGKLYMFFIIPMHKIIVKRMMGRLI